jgi:hypothetical protein
MIGYTYLIEFLLFDEICINKIEFDPDIFFCKNYIKRTLLVLEKHWSCEYDIIYLNSVITVLFLYKNKIKLIIIINTIYEEH